MKIKADLPRRQHAELKRATARAWEPNFKLDDWVRAAVGPTLATGWIEGSCRHPDSRRVNYV